MTKELRDVLGGAESATAGALPAYDEVVFTHGVAARVRRRRTMRSATTGALAGLGIVALGLGGYVAYEKLGDTSPVGPGPGPSASPSATQEPTPDPTGGGDATVADGLPSAYTLTSSVLDRVDSGWVLTIFDATFRPGLDDPTAGPKILYLVSPSGVRYEVADLSKYGSPHLAAWDTDREVAFFVENRYVAFTVDLASGQIAHEWEFCGEGGYLSAQDAPGDRWLLRGNCSGSPINGYYSDDGTFVTDDGVVPGGEGVTIIDVGDVQVRYEFEMPPDQSFVAYHADGTHVAMQPVGDDVGCYPIGPSLTGGLAVQCWGEDDVSIWSLDLNGGPAAPIASSETLNAIAVASGGAFPADGQMVVGYCVAGRYDALVTTHPVVAVLTEDSPWIPVDDELGLAPTNCYGGTGDTVLVTGSGALWTWNPLSGQTVTLVPVEPTTSGEYVGTSEGGAIIHP